MKIGYSILTGEFIQSDILDYKDCKNYQIICPNCKEPLFKVIRKYNQSDNIHYLSHYEKDKVYISECELRVQAISKTNINMQNAISRNQKLKYFLKVLQKAILKKFYISPYTIPPALKNINNSKNILFLRNLYFKAVKEFKIMLNKDDFDICANEYINEMEDLGEGFDKTSFAIDQQKRIAFDIWNYIFTPKGKPNFNFVFNHGYSLITLNVGERTQDKVAYDWEEFLFECMMALIDIDEKKGKDILNQLEDYKIEPPFVLEKRSLLFKMITSIAYEMVGTLIQLPYSELLKHK